MRRMKNPVGIRRGDILVLSVMLLLTAEMFAVDRFGKTDLCAEIYESGTLVQTVSFSDVTAPYTLTVGDCTLTVASDGIAFTDADCPDGLCVRRGKMTQCGDSMACVPNRVTVALRAKSGGVDAVTY